MVRGGGGPRKDRAKRVKPRPKPRVRARPAPARPAPKRVEAKAGRAVARRREDRPARRDATPTSKRKRRSEYVRKAKRRPGFATFARKDRFEDGSEKPTLASRRFPYTEDEHVAWANFFADSDDVWEKVKRDFGGRKPSVRPSQRYPGGSRHRGAAGYARRDSNSLHVTPAGYMGSRDDARQTLLHEIAHTRQGREDMPQWMIEGEAEARAHRLARKRLKQRPKSKTKRYDRYRRRYEKSR